jgi:hypothetical protein
VKLDLAATSSGLLRNKQNFTASPPEGQSYVQEIRHLYGRSIVSL